MARTYGIAFYRNINTSDGYCQVDLAAVRLGT